MYVQKILPAARERLAVISEGAAMIEAAKCLRGPRINLVVVCAPDGAICGVVSKTDVVDRISGCSGASCMMPVASVMTRKVVQCRAGDTLREVWDMMKGRGLKHVPVTDEQGHPVGVVTAREVMQALVEETEQEEELLRDYVMCVGYR